LLLLFKLLLEPRDTVWPQSGALSCDLLTRRICTPAATNSHGLYFFFFWLFFFKDKPLCFQRGNNYLYSNSFHLFSFSSFLLPLLLKGLLLSAFAKSFIVRLIP
jgi:hypothetical protein